MQQPFSIAIVEDDPDDLEFITTALRDNYGSIVLNTFSNGTEFIDFLDTTTGKFPSLVITDIRMPLVSGFEVISTVKGNEKTKDISIVVLSTSGDTEDIAMAKKLGATGYFVKPYTFDEYLDITNRIMTDFNKGLVGLAFGITEKLDLIRMTLSKHLNFRPVAGA